MIHFFLIVNRQGKVRLSKWFNTYSLKERARIQRDITALLSQRREKQSNFLDYREHTLVYKRYASLFFCMVIDKTDNELLALEIVHMYVNLLDKCFQNVCELDIVYNFDAAYIVLDEFLVAGEIQETSQRTILRAVADSTAHDDPQQLLEQLF